MEFEINSADREHGGFVYDCMQHLLSKPLYTRERFINYYERLLGETAKPDLWIAHVDGRPVGFISVVRFHMNRYLGYGVEFEEIVVHQDFQGQGFGARFIAELIDIYKQDADCRKVIIKSNDIDGSCRLYERLLDKTNFVVFSKRLNDLTE
jgi:GNAT superfamily N-acetyltransferase